MDEDEFLTLNDSTHDNQSGVYEHYSGRSDWLSKEIKRFAERGYELYKRLPKDGITIFRKIHKTQLDKIEAKLDKLLPEVRDVSKCIASMKESMACANPARKGKMPRKQPKKKERPLANPLADRDIEVVMKERLSKP